MIAMMKQFVWMVLLSGTVSLANAQEKPAPNADLKLSEQQTTQVRDINKTYIDGLKELRKNEALSKEDRKAKHDALSTSRKDQLKSVLDKDQYAKWEENQKRFAERKSRYHGKHGKKGEFAKGGKEGMRERRKGHHDRSEAAVKALGLTEKQSVDLKAINKEYMTKAMALKDADKAERREKFKSLHTERDAKVKLALGDEKFSQYNEWRQKERMQHRHSRKDGMHKKKPAAPVTEKK